MAGLEIVPLHRRASRRRRGAARGPSRAPPRGRAAAAGAPRIPREAARARVACRRRERRLREPRLGGRSATWSRAPFSDRLGSSLDARELRGAGGRGRPRGDVAISTQLRPSAGSRTGSRTTRPSSPRYDDELVDAWFRLCVRRPRSYLADARDRREEPSLPTSRSAAGTPDDFEHAATSRARDVGGDAPGRRRASRTSGCRRSRRSWREWREDDNGEFELFVGRARRPGRRAVPALPPAAATCACRPTAIDLAHRLDAARGARQRASASR